MKRQTAEHDDQEPDKPGADVALREGVHGADQTGAGEQGSEDGEDEGDEDEPDVPALHHAALLLHHDGVQEGGAGEPGHERGVFDGIPTPVAAPAENGVGPVHAEDDAAGEEEPRDHRPAAGDPNPLLTGVAHHQGAQREGEGNREADVAEVEHRRMNNHLGVLKQRIETEAVCRSDAAGNEGEGLGDEVDQQEEEDLHAGEDGGGVGVEGDVGFVAKAKDEAVGGEQPCPEQQRAFLPGPDGGELVEPGEGDAAVVEDVVDREIVGEEGPDQGEGGGSDGDEAGDAGAASGLTDAFRSDGQGAAIERWPRGRVIPASSVYTDSPSARRRETLPKNGMGWGMNVHFLR